jgi:hypothetical protein
MQEALSSIVPRLLASGLSFRQITDFIVQKRYISAIWLLWPITVSARSKAWTVFTRSNAGIVGSNLTQGMDVYVRLFCVYVVLCVGSGLATGWSPGRGALPTVYD